MLEVADIVRLHGAAYRARFGDRLLPSHTRALRDIEACRTPYFGGHLKQCDRCGRRLYSYHSCGNRACPKCHGEQTERWLEQSRARLLPCHYFLLTFTLPSELRALARSHQKQLYGALMHSAGAALQKLSLDPRYLGARIGALAVLHTWTRALRVPTRLPMSGPEWRRAGVPVSRGVANMGRALQRYERTSVPEYKG